MGIRNVMTCSLALSSIFTRVSELVVVLVMSSSLPMVLITNMSESCLTSHSSCSSLLSCLLSSRVSLLMPGALRDQLQGVEDELAGNCFICSISKDYLDQVPHGFDTHVQKEHNLSNYLFFLMYLINKDESDYTG